jgi:hypothetical protein
VDEPAGCFFVQSCGIDCIHETGRDNIEHLVQESSTLLALALLEYETSGHHWNQDKTEKHGFSGSRHTAF